MDKKELFDNIAFLLDKLKGYRQTQTLSFANHDEKLILQDVYKQIYPYLHVDLSCSGCVLSYLNNLEAWYEREYPKYAAERQISDPQADEPIVHYQGIKQEPEQNDGVKNNSTDTDEKPVKKARKTRKKKE